MRWNMRMKAAERGIWKSTELRRRLAEAGLEISDVICAVLECTPDELLILEPDKVAGLRPRKAATSNEPASPRVVPRLARERPAPPA
jgi:putative transcriptional regulator